MITWTEALKAYCESKVGQLASIHSELEKELAERAARCKSELGYYVWIGGRKTGSQWQWADNSTSTFTNWRSGHPRTSITFGCSLMESGMTMRALLRTIFCATEKLCPHQQMEAWESIFCQNPETSRLYWS